MDDNDDDDEDDDDDNDDDEDDDDTATTTTTTKTIMGHFRIFEKLTDLINSKLVKVSQYEAYGSREIE